MKMGNFIPASLNASRGVTSGSFSLPLLGLSDFRVHFCAVEVDLML